MRNFSWKSERKGERKRGKLATELADLMRGGTDVEVFRHAGNSKGGGEENVFGDGNHTPSSYLHVKSYSQKGKELGGEGGDKKSAERTTKEEYVNNAHSHGLDTESIEKTNFSESWWPEGVGREFLRRTD